MINIIVKCENVNLFVINQLLRHRSFTFQQFSGRYSKTNLKYDNIRARLQDTNNRQKSIELGNSIDEEEN
jgi:thymidylate synthase (FAD)